MATNASQFSQKMLDGWHHPTLRHVDGQWRIYSDSGTVFVPLDKAIPALVAACPGAGAGNGLWSEHTLTAVADLLRTMNAPCNDELARYFASLPPLGGVDGGEDTPF